MKSRFRRRRQAAAVLVLVFACLLAIGVTIVDGWVLLLGPRARALTSRTFEPTPARLERGKYLTEAVLGCMDCHSRRDWEKADAPIIPETKAGGAPIPIDDLPGRIIAPNISPDVETGAGAWSDDMLARSIREGIGHDGRALFPLMPYQSFSSLPDEDLASVIVYLRSLKPVRNELPGSEIAFPVNLLIKGVPRPITGSVPEPDMSSDVARGAFLVKVADCTGCHTPQQKGAPVPSLGFGGGFTLTGPFGRVASANLTPDPSGIPYYDEKMFIQTLRTGHVGARKLSSIMPWQIFKGMSDQDLKSVFAYLRTLEPVRHRVDNGEPPTPCKVCGGTHGGGEWNTDEPEPHPSEDH
ncbi:MAG TPA: c-type cytochrome [Blastocatellia bacterium]|jgi:cytochrome c553|nr:c-type cytochrome [Blastocatellia bacterium]